MAYPVASLPGNMVRYSDGSIGPAPSSGGIPTVTPFPTDPRNANPALRQGTTGPHLSPTSQPLASMSSGNVLFSGGVQYPRSSVNTSSGGTYEAPMNTSGGSGGEVLGDTDQGPSMEELMRAQTEYARGLWENGKTVAQQAYDRARGIYDEGMGVLGDKRKQFADLFDEGQQTILGRHEQERGNLQKSDANNQRRVANAMRAAGVTGGSAYMNYEGQRAQDNSRAAGNLNEQRETNDRANRGEFDSREEWARGRESELGRYLTDADNNRQNAENYGWSDFVGNANQIQSDMRGYYDKIMDYQRSLAASKGDIGAFKANPYTANMGNFLNTLNSPTIMGGQQSGDQNQAANIDRSQYSLEDLYKKSGLYA